MSQTPVIGTQVFDFATQAWSKVTEIKVEDDGFTVYILDSNIQLNPNFPSRGRLREEIGFSPNDESYLK